MGTHRTAVWVSLFVWVIGSWVARAETEVLRISGRVSVSEDKGKSWASLKRKKQFKDGVVFKTETNAFVDVRFDGGSLMRVTEGSSVGVDLSSKTNGDTNIQIDLKNGRLCAISTQLSTNSHFEIKTPLAVCGKTASGSRFEVSSRGVVRCNAGSVVMFYVVNPPQVPPLEVEPGMKVRPPASYADFPNMKSALTDSESKELRENLRSLEKSVPRL